MGHPPTFRPLHDVRAVKRREHLPVVCRLPNGASTTVFMIILATAGRVLANAASVPPLIERMFFIFAFSFHLAS
jgi:hypothetical protein